MIKHFTKNGRIGFVPPAIDDYAAAMSAPETQLRKELAAETRRKFKDDAVMMIGPSEAALLQVLILATSASKILEVGTFTGYSALAMQEVLPLGGRIITLEASAAHADVAGRYFRGRNAGRYAPVVLEGGDAHSILANFILTNLEGSHPPGNYFDLAFIDAEKTGYIDYWQKCKKLVRQGGLLIADNTLSCKRKPVNDRDGKAIADFNEFVRRDRDVYVAFTTIRDGMTIAFKK